VEEAQPQRLSRADTLCVVTTKGAGVDESSKIGRHARTVLATAGGLRQRAAALLAEPERLRGLAVQRYHDLGRDLTASVLRATPVDKLREVSPNLRVGALASAGFRTVSDVLHARQSELDAVPGVGRRTAQQALEAARRIEDVVREHAGARLDPDHRDPVQTALLDAVFRLRRADQVLGPVAEAMTDWIASVETAAREAERAGGRLRMLFARRRTREHALAALERLEGLLSEAGSVRATAARLNVPVDEDELWHDYERDAASYAALLAELGDADGDVDAARGFLTSDVEQQVDAVTLDTSRLTVSLRGYQEFGARFALARRRVIIGDEMGLGKTIEAIAALASVAARGRHVFLVVCPASVLVNWVDEIGRHSTLAAHRLHGAHRAEAVREWLDGGGVGVTTFGTLPKLSLSRRHRLAMVVVDEAHYVKNPASQRSRAVEAVTRRAERVLFLTGTPMENHVEEFRNLVSYLQPEIAARTRADDAVAGARAFRRAVAPVYLRRNQEDVLPELPEQLAVEDWVEFGHEDSVAYRDAVAEGNLMAMRRAAYAPGTVAGSAKLERLLEIVEESRENGWKVVVFSFFLDVLDTVHTLVGDDACGPLTGAVPATERQRVVDEFSARRGHAVLVSQIEAGGVGLNVQAASVVILAEPQWKPSTEEQAVARCHRMGQVRKVHVHRLLVKDSVDARMREVLEHKSLLFDSYARESDTKHGHDGALDTAPSRAQLEQRIVAAERERLGMAVSG
jgi:superfamily II DNA or RNA helicase